MRATRPGPEEIAISAAGPGAIQHVHRPFPFNGKVIDKSPQPVPTWSDDQPLLSIPAGSRSDFMADDIDFVQERGTQWYKIAHMTATVHPDGHVSPFACRSYPPPGGACFPEHGMPFLADAGAPGAGVPETQEWKTRRSGFIAYEL
jgi:hypothetical protein